MDNFRIDITHDRDDALAKALEIAFGTNQKAVGYRVDPEKGFILYWTDKEGVVPFPFKADAKAVQQIVAGWLSEQDYGPEPDHDGHNSHGWRLYNEAWGHVGGDWQAFLAIQPAWAMYGK